MASGRNFVQECFKSGFKNRRRDIEIIGDCMRGAFQTRGAVCAKLHAASESNSEIYRPEEKIIVRCIFSCFCYIISKFKAYQPIHNSLVSVYIRV